MKLYGPLIFPLLRRLDPELAHEWTLSALQLAQSWSSGRALLRRLAGPIPDGAVTAFGLTFPNVLGVAAGYDKDARVARGLGLLGFGHVEVGTLTPRPQEGNPRPRIFRLPEDGALINRMGFPNRGVVQAVARLHAHRPHRSGTIVGVSLGKQKSTPLSEAALDYLEVMRTVYKYADYLAVNVSSPNTPGLRDLQAGDYLEQLLQILHVENQVLARRHGLPPRPLLLKIAPDLTWPQLDAILTAALAHRVSGIIATNTTVERTGLQSRRRREQGGLSGRPLLARSLAIVSYIAGQAGDRLPVVGVGGVRSPADLQAMLDAGAVLVQLYTGLVFEGPGLPGRLLRSV